MAAFLLVRVRRDKHRREPPLDSIQRCFRETASVRVPDAVRHELIGTSTRVFEALCE
jgi:hypothetical protein